MGVQEQSAPWEPQLKQNLYPQRHSIKSHPDSFSIQFWQLGHCRVCSASHRWVRSSMLLSSSCTLSWDTLPPCPSPPLEAGVNVLPNSCVTCVSLHGFSTKGTRRKIFLPCLFQFLYPCLQTNETGLMTTLGYCDTCYDLTTKCAFWWNCHCHWWLIRHSSWLMIVFFFFLFVDKVIKIFLWRHRKQLLLFFSFLVFRFGDS
jgi:hypothetical protein